MKVPSPTIRSSPRRSVRFHEYPAAGGSKGDCEELIDHELGVAAQALMGLYADRTVAEDILAGAITQYLDDRFHVTNRRLLGLG